MVPIHFIVDAHEGGFMRRVTLESAIPLHWLLIVRKK
jgi:hypothetical protein